MIPTKKLPVNFTWPARPRRKVRCVRPRWLTRENVALALFLGLCVLVLGYFVQVARPVISNLVAGW